MARQERSGNSSADGNRGRSSTMNVAVKASNNPRNQPGNMAYSMEDVSVLGRQALTDNQSSPSDSKSAEIMLPGNGSLMNGGMSALMPISKISQLYEDYKAKSYMKGWLYRKNDLMPDGKPSQNRDWTLYYVELQGSQLTFWQPPQQMHHLAASLTDMGGIAFELEDRDETMRRIEFMKTRSKPAFINLTEGTTEWVGIFKKGKSSSGHRSGIFAVNSAGANRFFFQPLPTAPAQAPSPDPATIVLQMWVGALRLSMFEENLLSSLYTESLLYSRVDLRKMEAQVDTLPDARFAGYMQVRVAGTTEWKQYYCVVERRPIETTGQKNKKFGSSPQQAVGRGHILFFNDEKDAEKVLNPRRKSLFGGAKKVSALSMAMFELINVADAHLVYPEKPELAHISTVFKLQGGSFLLGGKAPKNFLHHAGFQNYDFGENIDAASASRTEIRTTPNYLLCLTKTQTEMAQWVFATWSAFGLHGKGVQGSAPIDSATGLPVDNVSRRIIRAIGQDKKLFLPSTDVLRADMRNGKYEATMDTFWALLDIRVTERANKVRQKITTPQSMLNCSREASTPPSNSASPHPSRPTSRQNSKPASRASSRQPSPERVKKREILKQPAVQQLTSPSDDTSSVSSKTSAATSSATSYAESVKRSRPVSPERPIQESSRKPTSKSSIMSPPKQVIPDIIVSASSESDKGSMKSDASSLRSKIEQNMASVNLSGDTPPVSAAQERQMSSNESSPDDAKSSKAGERPSAKSSAQSSPVEKKSNVSSAESSPVEKKPIATSTESSPTEVQKPKSVVSSTSTSPDSPKSQASSYAEVTKKNIPAPKEKRPPPSKKKQVQKQLPRKTFDAIQHVSSHSGSEASSSVPSRLKKDAKMLDAMASERRKIQEEREKLKSELEELRREREQLQQVRQYAASEVSFAPTNAYSHAPMPLTFAPIPESAMYSQPPPQSMIPTQMGPPPMASAVGQFMQRIPSPTPSDSISVSGEDHVPLGAAAALPNRAPQAPAETTGLISRISEKAKNRSTSYNPRTKSTQARSQGDSNSPSSSGLRPGSVVMSNSPPSQPLPPQPQLFRPSAPQQLHHQYAASMVNGSVANGSTIGGFPPRPYDQMSQYGHLIPQDMRSQVSYRSSMMYGPTSGQGSVVSYNPHMPYGMPMYANNMPNMMHNPMLHQAQQSQQFFQHPPQQQMQGIPPILQQSPPMSTHQPTAAQRPPQSQQLRRLNVKLPVHRETSTDSGATDTSEESLGVAPSPVDLRRSMPPPRDPKPEGKSRKSRRNQ